MSGEEIRFSGKVVDVLAGNYILCISVLGESSTTDIDLESLQLPESAIDYDSDVVGFMTREGKNLVASSISVKKDLNSRWQPYNRPR